MDKKTIKDIAVAWLVFKRPFVKVSTFAAYALIVQNHIVPVFGTSNTLTEDAVQKFVLQRLEQGMSVKTVKDILIVMKMVMKFGVKNGWTDYAEWDIKYPTASAAPPIEVLTVANHKKILAYIRENFTFRNLGIYICLTTGLRIGEVCALKWSDIDIVGGTLNVGRTIERIYMLDGDKKHTEVVVSTPKTANSCREIPLSRETLALIRPLMKVVNHDYFVITNEATPTEPRTYRNYYKRLMAKLNIPKLKFHGLRHSFATRCIESGCDYKTVSVILGHANISTTLDLYVHPNMEQKKRCIDKVFKALGHCRAQNCEPQYCEPSYDLSAL